jgi:Flp pilus assembly protein TadB
MSAAERSGDAARGNGPAGQSPGDLSRLQSRRRIARRRQHLARVDLGLGLVGALVLVLATPGLAITGLVALIVLVLCLLTFVLERRTRTRRSRKRDPGRGETLPGSSPDEL